MIHSLSTHCTDYNNANAIDETNVTDEFGRCNVRSGFLGRTMESVKKCLVVGENVKLAPLRYVSEIGDCQVPDGQFSAKEPVSCLSRIQFLQETGKELELTQNNQ